MKKTAHLRLTIDVCYDLNGASVAEMEEQLLQAASRLADNGELSGYSEADVSEWDSRAAALAADPRRPSR